MTLRCVVIDDERPAREKLKRLVAGVRDLELVGEAADANEAVRLIDEARPDLCFLDVQMPEGDGFEVLERAAFRPRVIFTTAHDEYAVRAFDVRSLDYLLKPFGKARFLEAVERARETRGDEQPAAELASLLSDLKAAREGDGRTEPERIAARKGNKILLLQPAEVLWFEAEETLVFGRTAAGRFLVERTLADLEELLSESFFRAHRRFLINLGLIAEILPGEAGTYRIVMRDEAGSTVPLSRRQARKLRERIPW